MREFKDDYENTEILLHQIRDMIKELRFADQEMYKASQKELEEIWKRIKQLEARK